MRALQSPALSVKADGKGNIHSYMARPATVVFVFGNISESSIININFHQSFARSVIGAFSIPTEFGTVVENNIEAESERG